MTAKLAKGRTNSLGNALRRGLSSKEIQKNTQELEELSQNIANFIYHPLKIDLQKEIPDTIFTQFGKKFIKKGEEIKTKIKEITDVTDYEKLLEAIQDIIIDIVFRNVN